MGSHFWDYVIKDHVFYLGSSFVVSGWLIPEEVSACVGKQPWWRALETDLKNRPASSQLGFPGGASSKEPSANAGDRRYGSSIPGLGRFPGGGHGNPLQYSCLENPMDRGAWWVTVDRVTQTRTWLKQLSVHIYPSNCHVSEWAWELILLQLDLERIVAPVTSLDCRPKRYIETEIINACWFKPLNFRAICYAAKVANRVTTFTQVVYISLE